MLKNNKSKLVIMGLFLVFVVVLIYVFRSLFGGFDKNLTSWLDIPYVIWVMGQNIEKFRTFSFGNFFETNAFYSNKLTLLFSDTLIPQSLIFYIFSMFSRNLVLCFNFTLILTLILNYWSVLLFWCLFTKNKIIAFLGTMFFIFSPFFFYQFGHFQMMSYWPLFFSLYFLIKQNKRFSLKNSILSGIFLAIQFLAAVYLSIFLMVIIGVFLLINFSTDKFSPGKGLVVLTIFLLFSGVFIRGYLEVKRINSFVRDPAEYITYSAHLSDYLFTSNRDTVFNRNKLVNRWNSFDQHFGGERAGFPGFLILILSIIGLIKISLPKKDSLLEIIFDFDKHKLIFLLLILTGFGFSLGTRLSFNGVYSSIPIPYNFLVKFVPFFDTIRSTARWSFLFYLGMVGLSIYGLEKILLMIKGKWLKIFVIILVSVVFVLENLPLKVDSHFEDYYVGYQKIEKLCTERKRLLLELPVSHMDFQNGVVNGLNYISKVEMASVRHGCYLFNGYSGYEPKNIEIFRSNVMNINNTNEFLSLLKKEKIEILKNNDNRWNIYIEDLDKSGDLKLLEPGVYLVR